MIIDSHHKEHHEREDRLLELLREIKEMIGYCPFCWASFKEPCADKCKLGEELGDDDLGT